MRICFRVCSRRNLAPLTSIRASNDQYCRELERTLSALEAALHVSDDPEEIAMMAMKTACDFYQAD